MENVIFLFLFTIIFFSSILFTVVFYFTKKGAKAENNISQEIIEEIDLYIEKSLDKLENEKSEIDKKIAIIDEKISFLNEKEIEYNNLIKEKINKEKISKINIEPRKTDFREKNKKEIKQLYNEGYTVEEISKRLKMHKGFIETILNIQEFDKSAK